MMTPAKVDRPVLVFDGQCGFCRQTVARLKTVTGERIEYLPFQEAGERFATIPAESFTRSVHLIEPDGRVTRAAEAVFRTLAIGGDRGGMLWCYRHVPLFAPLSELGYRAVARLRPVLSPITNILHGRSEQPTSYVVMRRCFERCMGAIYLIAFLSLWVQFRGLIGENGILPAGEFLSAVKSHYGNDAWWRVPTLCWWIGSDNASLNILILAGVGLSLLTILRLWSGLCFLLMWIVYLSLVHVGQVFLRFQWDSLLLETGLLAVFFASWSWRPRPASERPPSIVVIWLFRLLLFRLMFLSGMTKLAWQDQCWRDLTALTYHYWTQCIPNPVAWYVHQFPLWFHKACCGMMFFIEIATPFLMFLSRRPRIICFVLQVMLQLTIIATGNYNFFNLLTILLCLPLLDDRALKTLSFGWIGRKSSQPDQPCRDLRWRPWWIRGLITIPLALVVIPMGALHIWETSKRTQVSWVPPSVREGIAWTQQSIRSLNSYGLFRVMTKERPEIIIEGSHDNQTWLAYEFRYKAGDVARRPPWVAPHQPRLDWQMWFAALGNPQQSPWFPRLMRRIQEGSPDVLALLQTNPFPDAPPKYLRAVSYRYHFTTPDERRESGNWWKRDDRKLWFPTMTRRGNAIP